MCVASTLTTEQLSQPFSIAFVYKKIKYLVNVKNIKCKKENIDTQKIRMNLNTKYTHNYVRLEQAK